MKRAFKYSYPLDVFHDALVHNAGVPSGWPGFCMTFDVTAAVLVACVLVFRPENKVRLSGLGSH